MFCIVFYIICRIIVSGVVIASEVSLQLIYQKINDLEEKIAKLEKRIVPEECISAKEAAELEKIRQEIKRGETISEKELFSILSK